MHVHMNVCIYVCRCRCRCRCVCVKESKAGILTWSSDVVDIFGNIRCAGFVCLYLPQRKAKDGKFKAQGLSSGFRTSVDNLEVAAKEMDLASISARMAFIIIACNYEYHFGGFPILSIVLWAPKPYPNY